jgi:hypothetical protein
VLVCRSATADHLYEECFGLQCITSYRRIKQQNGLLSAANTRAYYLPHLSELATSLATSTRLHILVLQSDRLHPVAAVAAPASVPHKQKKEESGQSAGPSAGPPVLASVPLGEASGSYTGDGPFWTRHAPHTWQHVSARHMPHLP